MRLWRRRSRQDDIRTGQRFRSVGPSPILWEVERVAGSPGEVVPHVRLQRVGFAGDGKTVALQVLRDRRFYQPDP